MARKVRGICCICGQETDLTFEHIPPRAAYNHFGLKLYDFFGYILRHQAKYQLAQKGMGGYTLCPSCNNRTGEYYGSAYAQFARQGVEYYRKNAQGLMMVPYTFYPLRVFKQVISCFASVNGANWCQNSPEIRKFLLDPYERRFPSEFDIYMYMHSKGRSKMSPILGTMNTKTGERYVASEWGYVPFSYILVCKNGSKNNYTLGDLLPIKAFLNYEYNDITTIYLAIPKKPCNPMVLDFREGVPDIASMINSDKLK